MQMIMARPAESSGPANGHPAARGVGLPGIGPTVPPRLRGAQLRRLREERGITLEDAGEVIRASGSKMSRLETGRVGFKDRDIADLLTFYEVTDEQQRAALHQLARGASSHGWWHDYSDVMPAWFESYVGLEEAAVSIRTYEIQFVPGLLQTEDYARAVTLLGHDGEPSEEIEQRVALRMGRQALLTGPHPTHLWAGLGEAVPPSRAPRRDAPSAAADPAGCRAPQRHHPGHPVLGGSPRCTRRPVQHPAPRREIGR